MHREQLAAMIQVGGISFLSIAGFTINFALGCLVVGVSLLVIGLAVERRP